MTDMTSKDAPTLCSLFVMVFLTFLTYSESSLAGARTRDSMSSTSGRMVSLSSSKASVYSPMCWMVSLAPGYRPKGDPCQRGPF